MTVLRWSHLRNLRKHSLFTTINVLGLTLCLPVAIIIFSYVRFEFSFDDYHPNKENIYRVTWEFSDPSGYHIHWARVPVDFVNELPERYSPVKRLARLQSFRPRNIKVAETVFREEFAYSADPETLDFFDFEIKSGQPSLAPFTAILTAGTAKKYFGDKDPIGEEIIDVREDGQQVRYTINAVIEDQPGNTHLPLNLITSINTDEERTGWAFVYVELIEDANAQELASSFEPLIAENDVNTDFASFHLQPLTDIHLKSKLARELKPNGDLQTTLLFMALGILLVIIATINFTNLNTAQALGRSRIFGVRKVLGSSRSQLMLDFFIESVVISLGSLTLSLLIVTLLKDFIPDMFGMTIQFDLAFTVVTGLALAIIIAIFSSLAPMLKFSRSHSLQDLKGNGTVEGNSYAKKSLLGFQFFVALSMLSGLFIFRDQVAYLSSKSKGYNAEQVLVLEAIPSSLTINWERLRAEIESIPGISETSAAMQLPSTTIRDRARVLVKGIHDEADFESAPFADTQIIDTNYDDFLGIQLVAGRGFESYDHQIQGMPEGSSLEEILTYVNGQKRKYLLNETAVKTLGVRSAEEAVGKQLRMTNGFFDFGYGEIVGVMQDYHQESLKEEIDPMVFIYEPIWFRDLLVKTENENYALFMKEIRGVWTKVAPDYPLEFAFLDQEFEKQFLKEQQQLSLIQAFSGLAVFIAVIGVFGLIAFALQSRKREVAIRQVLGANLKSVLLLFLKQYLALAILGLALSLPVVYWITNEWLTSFAYRIPISYFNFLFAGMILVALLSLLVTFRVRQTCQQNPAQVLKVE